MWNIRCACNMRGRRHTKDLVRKYRPSMFVLLKSLLGLRGLEFSGVDMVMT